VSLPAAETDNTVASDPPQLSAADLRSQLDAALERVDDDDQKAGNWRGRKAELAEFKKLFG
jgi:hypothetical protein